MSAGNATLAAVAYPSTIAAQRVGRILTVGLNRPVKRNALDEGIMVAIRDFFATLPDDTGAVMVHGVGVHPD